MTEVALSGASGQLGRFLRPALLTRGVNLRSAGGRHALTALHSGEHITHGDLRDPAKVDALSAERSTAAGHRNRRAGCGSSSRGRAIERVRISR